MTDASTSYRLVLFELFRHPSGMDLYEIHKKHRLSPGQLLQVVSSLQADDRVELSGTFARLTEAARRWLVINRHGVFRVQERVWEDSPWAPESKRIEPGQPYLPDLSQVEKGFFLKR